MSLMMNEKSPLDFMDVSFAHYVSKRRIEEQSHMDGGVPDYAFSLDYKLRRQMEKIPHFSGLCKKVSATIETREMQIYNQKAVAVGPNQYADIYQIGIDCAKRLCIGIPNIYIFPSTEINAFTYASDSVSPMIVIYTGLLDRLELRELRCVIAHECGHIHNQHMIYKNVIRVLLNGGTGFAGFILSAANMALMQFWTRACEVTADRAGAICADNIEDAINVQKKLLSGGTINEQFRRKLDIEALKDQLDTTINNPTRLYEVLSDHPSGIRRIFCLKEFEECDVYYRWRTDLKKSECIARSKIETDDRCQKLINIWENNSVNNLKYAGQQSES